MHGLYINLIFDFLQLQTLKLLGLLIICGMGIVCVTHFLMKPSQRAIVVGWICLVFSLCVFVAPLCILVSLYQKYILSFSFKIIISLQISKFSKPLTIDFFFPKIKSWSNQISLGIGIGYIYNRLKGGGFLLSFKD